MGNYELFRQIFTVFSIVQSPMTLSVHTSTIRAISGQLIQKQLKWNVYLIKEGNLNNVVSNPLRNGYTKDSSGFCASQQNNPSKSDHLKFHNFNGQKPLLKEFPENKWIESKNIQFTTSQPISFYSKTVICFFQW